MSESIQPMTGAEWLRIVKRLTYEFPRHPLPDDTINAWFETLAPLGADAVRAAVTAYIAEGHEFPPSSSGVLRKLAAPPTRSWDDAWGELLRAIRRYGAPAPGRPAPPPFDDPALQRLVEQRGWGALCALPENDTTVHAQLRDAYHGAQRQIDYEIRAGIYQAIGAGRVDDVVVSGAVGPGEPTPTGREWAARIRQQTSLGAALEDEGDG